jgi:hypothetical protein
MYKYHIIFDHDFARNFETHPQIKISLQAGVVIFF